MCVCVYMVCIHVPIYKSYFGLMFLRCWGTAKNQFSNFLDSKAAAISTVQHAYLENVTCSFLKGFCHCASLHQTSDNSPAIASNTTLTAIQNWNAARGLFLLGCVAMCVS